MLTPHWIVTGPEHTEYEYLEHMIVAAYPAFDTVCIEAATRREARWLAIKTPEFRQHLQDSRGDGTHPLAGLTVRPAECPHGFCGCWGLGCDRWPSDLDACPACENIFLATEEGRAWLASWREVGIDPRATTGTERPTHIPPVREVHAT